MHRFSYICKDSLQDSEKLILLAVSGRENGGSAFL